MPLVMSDDRYLYIGEIVRRTGLTERALRFYEAQGLICPPRTEAGRRVYGAAELTRLHHITLLKRAGFSLARIREVLAAHDLDAGEVLRTQIELLEAERASVNRALTALRNARRSLENGAALDAESLLNLIQLGERTMQDEAWKKIIDRYYTPEEQAHWKAAKEKMAEGVDQEAYDRQWRNLNRRIAVALPLDPVSDRARAFMAEWNDLLKPFTQIADAQMMAGAGKLWERMDEWEGEVDSPISKEVWAFMSEVGKRMKEGS